MSPSNWYTTPMIASIAGNFPWSKFTQYAICSVNKFLVERHTIASTVPWFP